MAQQRHFIAAHDSRQVLNHRRGIEQRQLRGVDIFVRVVRDLRYVQLGMSGRYSGPRHQAGGKFETDTRPGARERAASANPLVNIVIMPPGRCAICSKHLSPGASFVKIRESLTVNSAYKDKHKRQRNK